MMLVAFAAIGLVLVTLVITLADIGIQRKRNNTSYGVNGQTTMRKKNTWELTQLDCDIGCAWPHTSGPARTLYFSKSKLSDGSN